MRRPGPRCMDAALFAYGTLVFEEVMAAVAGRAGEACDAVLPGYVRRALRGAACPGILPGPGAGVPGRLWTGLGPGALARLDRFEGPAYRRAPVRVLAGGRELPAFAYVLRPGWRWMATGRDWSPEAHRARCIAAYAGGRGR